MRILVSGFEPFLEEQTNPTQQIANFVNSCDWHRHPGFEEIDIRGVVLPVLFDGAYARFEQERLLFRPDVVLNFGLAGGRDAIELEQVAINMRGGHQAARGDNRGQVFDGPIDLDGPLSIETSLPSERLIGTLMSNGVPARKSFSAGTYVCNDLFYRVQSRLRFTRVISGFIHVPRMTEDNGLWPWAKFELATRVILSEVARSV